MISADNARALMERKFIDTVEQKIIKAATSGYQDERKTPSFSYGDISDKSQYIEV